LPSSSKYFLFFPSLGKTAFKKNIPESLIFVGAALQIAASLGMSVFPKSTINARDEELATHAAKSRVIAATSQVPGEGIRLARLASHFKEEELADLDQAFRATSDPKSNALELSDIKVCLNSIFY
jgi:hypothetical protein